MSNDHSPFTGPTIPMRRPNPRPNPRPSRGSARPAWGTWFRFGVLALLLLILAGLLLGWAQVRQLADQTVVPDVRRGVFSVPPAVPFTILLIGIDERPDHPEEGVRGDTLILARVDPAGGWVAFLSIPRDTLANVRDLGTTKINAAYGYGYNNPEALYSAGTTPREAGMALATETVSELLGIPIDYAAQVNFAGFAGVVDAVGGVMIDVPRRIVDDEYPTPDFGVTQIVFEPGPQHMDGERALIYARTRHADSDFGRAERQQQVIRAIMDAMRARGLIGQLTLVPALRASIGDTIATTLPFDRPDATLALMRVASSLKPEHLLRLQISPETAAFREEGSALVWEPADLKLLVEQFLRGPSIESEAARIQVLNATAISGLAGRTTNELAREGLKLLPAGDAPVSDQQRTTVYDLHAKPLTARKIADLLKANLRAGPLPDGIFSEADIVVIVGQP